VQNLKNSLDDFIKNVENSIVKNVTFLFVDMYKPINFKQYRLQPQWVLEVCQFYNACTAEIESQNGEVIKFLDDGVLALFGESTDALNCAIKIQEKLFEQRKFYGGAVAKIGVATGSAYKINLFSNFSDYLGEAVDISKRLCDITRGNGITLDKQTYSFAQTPLVGSLAGRAVARTTNEYFGTLAHIDIGGKSIAFYHLHWAFEKKYIDSEATETKEVEEEDKKSMKTKCFIVHGHDTPMKTQLEILLHEFGLEPVVLHRQADECLAIIEKLEKHSNVEYAFILLTPDDIGYPISEESKEDSKRSKEKRARQNVIFEFGYFIAKLGRNKVCCLYKEGTSLPTDISGVAYKKIINKVEEVAFAIQKDLKAAGYNVNI